MVLNASSSPVAHALQNVLLIWLSFVLIPLDTFIAVTSYAATLIAGSPQQRNRAAIRSPRTPYFEPKTILVTGVGMAKGLALARIFYAAGHNVIGADFEPFNLPVSSGRVSRSLKKFRRLARPEGDGDSDAYTESILEIVRAENVDMWVSCSGVASAVEDGVAREAIERLTKCKAIQYDAATTQKLHEKHSFMEYTESIGLPVPESHTITSRAAALQILGFNTKAAGKQYIFKYIGTDDSVRGDLTLLPLDSPAATKSHIDKLPISEDRPWILQQFIKGPEFCTHALIIRGQVKAFVACPSSELLMHYRALPLDSPLSKELLRITTEYAAAGGDDFTGHLSFDFLMEENPTQTKPGKGDSDAPKLYMIECNPRAHTAVVLFNDTPELADAYMSLLKPPSWSTTAANGARIPSDIVTPRGNRKYFWVGHDLVALVIYPLLRLLTSPSRSSLVVFVEGLRDTVRHLLFWNDGTFAAWDPLPAWWLLHVYWPVQFAFALAQGKKWSRVNVSTTKMFTC